MNAVKYRRLVHFEREDIIQRNKFSYCEYRILWRCLCAVQAWRIRNEHEFHCHDVWLWNGCAYGWLNCHVQMGVKENQY